MAFCLHFGVQNLPKMRQHGLKKPSQGAMIAKRIDFKKCCFVFVFYSISGTSGLPREPQDSQEASQSASRWPPGALPKKGPLFDSILGRKMPPK